MNQSQEESYYFQPQDENKELQEIQNEVEGQEFEEKISEEMINDKTLEEAEEIQGKNEKDIFLTGQTIALFYWGFSKLGLN